MIGWMSMTATRNPFHKPQSRPTPSASSRMTKCESPAWMRQAITAPQIAMIEPTERSMPLVLMTTAMPSATTAVGIAR